MKRRVVLSIGSFLSGAAREQAARWRRAENVHKSDLLQWWEGAILEALDDVDEGKVYSLRFASQASAVVHLITFYHSDLLSQLSNGSRLHIVNCRGSLRSSLRVKMYWKVLVMPTQVRSGLASWALVAIRAQLPLDYLCMETASASLMGISRRIKCVVSTLLVTVQMLSNPKPFLCLPLLRREMLTSAMRIMNMRQMASHSSWQRLHTRARMFRHATYRWPNQMRSFVPGTWIRLRHFHICVNSR